MVEQVRQEAPAEGEVETQTGLSEGQIRMLPVPARLKLARGASRQLRTFLLRDTNPQVALAALLGNPLSDQEVEHAASSRAVAEEVLEAIARKREWVSRYNVAKLLAQNPRTPLPISMQAGQPDVRPRPAGARPRQECCGRSAFHRPPVV